MNITVTDVDWNFDSLTDTTVTWRLRELPSFVRSLALDWNSLTDIPPFTQYWQIDTLEELSLSSNKIRTLVWDNIPTEVQVLGLSDNKLERLPPVRHTHRCLKVRQLFLNNNMIRMLHADMVPATVEELQMGGNQLIEVGDISQLTLHLLDLEANNIREMRGDYLPASLQELWLENLPLTETVDLRHLVNLTDLWVSPSDCQQYKEMLPNLYVDCVE